FSWPQGAARRYLMPAATGDDLLIPRNCLIDLPEHGGAAPGRGIRAEIVWHLRLGPRDAPSARPWSWIEDAFPPLGLRRLSIHGGCPQAARSGTRPQQQTAARDSLASVRPADTFGSGFPHLQSRLGFRS